MNSLKTYFNTALNDHKSTRFIVTETFLSLVTIISIVAIILETVPSLSGWEHLFIVIEWTCVAIFSVEYLARLFTSDKKIKYIFSFWGITDLLAILPTFIGVGNFTFLKSVRTLRLLRLMRILRIAKISRAYLQSHESADSAKEFDRINFVIYFLALFSTTVVFGAALYAAEHTQRDYDSIPLAMIQSAKILLGGIGQTAPQTLTGEIIMIIGRLAGLALFGLLISVIGGALNHLLFGASRKK